MKIERILLPTDFSEASTEVLERAVVLARQNGAHLRIFHADLVHARASARLADRRADVLERVDVIRRSCGDVPGEAAPVEFACEPAVSVGDALLHDIAEHRPDLVVMATHGGGLLMGSVAERIVREAPCSVLTSRLHAQGSWPMWKGSIVVPVDFSACSKRALEAARFVANGSPITLVHVVDAPAPATPYRNRLRLPFELDPSLREGVEAHMREWAGDPVDAVVALQGDVPSVLLDECRRHAAVLVVIGTHSLVSPTKWLIGSTAERMTRTCPAPVLTVR